ncbi:MAG: dihydroorotate dehydrogenase electron transfer subunit [Acidobacteriota bacterium]
MLVERRVLSPDASVLYFESPFLSSASSPGQFTMLRVDGPGLLLRRPYSFCDAEPASGRFSLLVKVVGAGTRALAELAPGSAVSCLGPLGTVFRLPEAKERAVIVAGGVGIAPFVGFCRSLACRGRVAHVLLGGKRAHDLYLREDFEGLGMKVTCATEDGSYGYRGQVTDLLPPLLRGAGPFRLYSCGPAGMLKRVAVLARERRIPHQVSIERRMGCGMGCCLGCVVFTRRADVTAGEYRRACTEGPVFDAEEICWERDPHPL